MKNKIVLTILTLFTIVWAKSSTITDSLDILKENIYNRYVFMEIDKDSLVTATVEEGDSVTVETTLDADLAFSLLAIAKNPDDEISITVLDNNGKPLSKMSETEINEYAGKDIDKSVALKDIPASAVAWVIPNRTDFYKIKITLNKSAFGSSSELAFILLYENVSFY